MTVAEVLATPKWSGNWFDRNGHAWSATDIARLRLLSEAGVDPTKAADAIGRPPSAIAWRARNEGFAITPEWRRLAAGNRQIVRPEPRIQLAYPYIVRKLDSHADLLAVNKLVPAMPGREDVCQEIMLAMWEGRVTLPQLRASVSTVRSFITFFRRLNFERSGYATSMDAVIPGTNGLRLSDTFSNEDSMWAD